MGEKEENEKEALNQSVNEQLFRHNVKDFSDLDTGWAWVILFASFGTFFLLGMSAYAVGITHSTLLDRYRENVSLTSWAGALHIAMLSIGAPLSSLIIDRFSCRTAMISSGLFFIIGYVTTAFANSIEVAIFTYGIIAGAGSGLGYTAAMVVVGLNFKRRRNLALGIAVSGTGAGLFVLAPVMQIARDYYGPMGFFFILAALTANIVTFGMLCFPSKLELHTQKQRQLTSVRNAGSQSCFTTVIIYFNVLFNKGTICLSISMFFYGLGTYLIYLFLPTYIMAKQFSATQASFLVSLSGVVSLFGRLLTGVVANTQKINVAVIYSGSMLIVGIASMCYPLLANYLAGHVIYVIWLGLFFGSCFVTITAMSLKFVGIGYLAAAIGLEMYFGGIGGIVGPVIAGKIVDAGGTYDSSIIGAAVCILLGGLLSGATMCFQQTNDDSEFRLEEIIETPEKLEMDTEQTCM